MRKHKFKVDEAVLFNGNRYTISAAIKGQNGNWYTLTNRLGNVHETELKKALN